MFFSSRILAPLALAALATPALATTIDHQVPSPQGALQLRYTPEMTLSVSQRGLGPREMPRCAWKTSYALERTVTRADGAVIAPLARVTPLAEPQSGMSTGSCAKVRREMANGGALPETIRSLAKAEAARDARQFETELPQLLAMTP